MAFAKMETLSPLIILQYCFRVVSGSHASFNDVPGVDAVLKLYSSIELYRDRSFAGSATNNILALPLGVLAHGMMD